MILQFLYLYNIFDRIIRSISIHSTNRIRWTQHRGMDSTKGLLRVKTNKLNLSVGTFICFVKFPRVYFEHERSLLVFPGHLFQYFRQAERSYTYMQDAIYKPNSIITSKRSPEIFDFSFYAIYLRAGY